MPAPEPVLVFRNAPLGVAAEIMREAARWAIERGEKLWELESLFDAKTRRDYSSELRKDDVFQLLAIYDACAILEARDRATARGGRAAILADAIAVCASSREDVVGYGQAHLSAKAQAELINRADAQAAALAGAELDALGVPADPAAR